MVFQSGWYSVTNMLAGATNSTYTIFGVGPANVGNYFVQVSSPYGITNSAPRGADAEGSIRL